jgi:hypothetical protein
MPETLTHYVTAIRGIVPLGLPYSVARSPPIAHQMACNLDHDDDDAIVVSPIQYGKNCNAQRTLWLRLPRRIAGG